MYRTSNQAYGSRAPTVHEMPVRRRQGRGLGVCVYGACVSVSVCVCARGCVRCVCVPEFQHHKWKGVTSNLFGTGTG